MYNAYNINNTSPIIEAVTSNVYINASRRISRMMCLQGLDILMYFATYEQKSRFNADRSVPNPEMYGYKPLQSMYYYTNNDQGNLTGNSCMFVYHDFGTMAWDKRICGSTDNHYNREPYRVRAFMGDTIQSRRLLENFCCETREMNVNLSERLDLLTDAFLNGLQKVLKATLINAMFSPVSERYNNNYKTVTFDQDSKQIDLTGALSTGGILGKLATVTTAIDCMEEYFWFVPVEFYSALTVLRGNDQCNGSIQKAMVKNGMGEYVHPGQGLQFELVSNIKIFALPKEYFPVNSSGKIMTPLYAKGSIAFSIMSPPELATGLAPQLYTDLMSVSKNRFEAEANAVFDEASAIKMMLFGTSSGSNLNGEISCVTSLVAGRLPGNLYHVLVDAAPTVAPPVVATIASTPSPAPIAFSSDIAPNQGVEVAQTAPSKSKSSSN